MNYAMGHAFCTSEIFKNFPYKKMNMKCKDSLKLTNANNREPYVCKIFRTMFSYIIQDIIDNNIITETLNPNETIFGTNTITPIPTDISSKYPQI